MIWTPDGGERREPVADFVRGAGATTLAPGEVIRAVDVPLTALAAPTAFRRIALTPLGRAASVVVGCGSTVTVTAATTRPGRRSTSTTSRPGWRRSTAGTTTRTAPADWRAHVTGLLAREVRAELRSGAG